MRLIDADELLAAYDAQHEGPPGKARKLIENAPTVTTAPAWISVKDHPPENGEDVINYGYYIGQYGETYPTTIISDIDEFKGYGCVPIAWMPLPEPPEEGDND